MNYYEHHIRDYDAATAHLTWDEDMAYTRLLRWYYRKEQPLPTDVAEVCRLVRASSKPQRAAVEAVLREFFELQADGWHHDVCDEAIERYRAGEPEREAKKKNEDTRLARHRQERAELFAIINAAGQHLPWNCKIEDLRKAAEAVKAGGPAPAAATGNQKPATAPATAPATPATATQTPDTNHHTPELILSGGAALPPAQPPAAPPPAPKPPKPKAPKDPGPTVETWEAYSAAYTARYRVAPVRNATVNGQLSQLVARLGAEEAPKVAAFYVSVEGNNGFYARAKHPVPLLLRDAEALRTSWATGERGVATAPSERAARMQQAVGPLAQLVSQPARQGQVLDAEADHGAVLAIR